MLENLNTLEERIEKPGYLLFLVTTLLLLIIGLVNVISFESYWTPIIGRFSIVHIGMLLVLVLLILVTGALMTRPNQDAWLKAVLGFIANRPIILAGMLAAYAVVMLHMFTADTWLFLPVLQFSLLALMLIFLMMVLLHDWDGDPGPNLLRRGLVYLIAGLIGIEIVLQLLAMATVLPSVTTDLTSLAPRDRLYYVGPDTTINTTTNGYGFHYPDFRLADDSYRVALLGDQAIQSLAVPKEQNMGVHLDDLIADADLFAGNSEVLSLGFQDYGAYVYLDVPFWLLFEAELQPDEVIIFVDFNNDFQLITASDGLDPYFFIEGDELMLSDDDFWLRHEILHASLFGLEGFQPRRFFKSHYLTLGLLQNALSAEPVSAANLAVAPQEDVALPNSFVFYEESNDEAMAILTAQLDLFLANAAEKGIKVSIVTIPVFPAAFYDQADNENWTTQFGEADLALPERELRAFAAAKDVSILTMTDYFRGRGLSTSDVDELYFEHVHGGLTPAGHALFAEAAFGCFFAADVAEASGCHLAE